MTSDTPEINQIADFGIQTLRHSPNMGVAFVVAGTSALHIDHGGRMVLAGMMDKTPATPEQIKKAGRLMAAWAQKDQRVVNIMDTPQGTEFHIGPAPQQGVTA